MTSDQALWWLGGWTVSIIAAGALSTLAILKWAEPRKNER